MFLLLSLHSVAKIADNCPTICMILAPDFEIFFVKFSVEKAIDPQVQL